MPYQIRLDEPAATDDFDALPLRVQEYCVRQLRILAEDPTALSSRSRFPYIEACQIFQFGCIFAQEVFDMCAVFQYGQDEETIFVLGIGVTHPSKDSLTAGMDFPVLD